MDDMVRPLQAAKRRIAHGEQQSLPTGLGDDLLSLTDSNMSTSSDSDTESDIVRYQKEISSSRKRNHSQAELSAPTRRSSREKPEPKMSYNIKIHPQDEELGMLSADENGASATSPKRRKMTPQPVNVGQNPDSNSRSTYTPKRTYREVSHISTSSSPVDSESSIEGNVTSVISGILGGDNMATDSCDPSVLDGR